MTQVAGAEIALAPDAAEQIAHPLAAPFVGREIPAPRARSSIEIWLNPCCSSSRSAVARMAASR